MKLTFYLVFVFITFCDRALCFDYCNPEFTYLPGIGCYHFGNVEGGLTWTETFFYCDQLDAVVVSIFRK